MNNLSVWLSWCMFALAFMSVVIIQGAEPQQIIFNGVAITFIGQFDKIAFEYINSELINNKIDDIAHIKFKDLTQSEIT